MGEKHFNQWHTLKQKLDGVAYKAPLVSEGDIWWLSIGENIGSEMNGKSEQFSRPAVILKKLAHNFYLIAPTTTKEKIGSWYVPIRHKGTVMQVCLHQIRTVDYRRLSSKLGSLDDADRANIRTGFLKLYG